MEQELLSLVTSLITNVGFPITLIILAGVAFWRVGKPAIEKLTNRHVTFIDNLEKLVMRISENLEGMRALHQDHQEALAQVDERLKTIESHLDLRKA